MQETDGGLHHLTGRRSAQGETAEDTMTTTPGNASSNLPGKPPVVDLAT